MLKKETAAQIDYLSDWPSHYYEIPSAEEKKKYLDMILEKEPDSAADIFRLEILKKRFFTLTEDGHIDAFLHAFTMIGASAAAGIPFFQKRQRKKELEQYMELLWLTGFGDRTETEQKILTMEWEDFVFRYLISCFDSKAYRSTIFGMIPAKDPAVARKLAKEIKSVIRDYPARLGMEREFDPLYRCFERVYCERVEDAGEYWDHSK